MKKQTDFFIPFSLDEKIDIFKKISKNKLHIFVKYGKMCVYDWVTQSFGKENQRRPERQNGDHYVHQ
jgi:hypothetical protein